MIISFHFVLLLLGRPVSIPYQLHYIQILPFSRAKTRCPPYPKDNWLIPCVLPFIVHILTKLKTTTTTRKWPPIFYTMTLFNLQFLLFLSDRALMSLLIIHHCYLFQNAPFNKEDHKQFCCYCLMSVIVLANASLQNNKQENGRHVYSPLAQFIIIRNNIVIFVIFNISHYAIHNA